MTDLSEPWLTHMHYTELRRAIRVCLLPLSESDNYTRCHGIGTKWTALGIPGAAKLGSNSTGEVVALSTRPSCKGFLTGSLLHN